MTKPEDAANPGDSVPGSAAPATAKEAGGAKDTKPRRAAPAKTAAKPRKDGAPATATAAAHSRVGHGWLWIAVVALALASGGSIASIWFLESAARDEQTRRLEAMIQSISPSQIAERQNSQAAALEARIGALEQKLAGMPDLGAAKEAEAATGLLAEKLDGLAGRLSDIEKSIGQLHAQPAGGDEETRAKAKQSADEVAALKERIAALEQTKQTVSTEIIERNQALVVAVGQLRDALASSKPFVQELAGVSQLGNPGITQITDRIAPFADKGVATTGELRDAFPEVATNVMHASGSERGGDWIDKAIAHASTVVTVRKVGDVAGDTAEAALARAENRLAVDDLDGAVGEMAQLQGPAAEAASGWMDKAKARVAAEKALKDLHLQVIGQIAQSDGPPK